MMDDTLRALLARVQARLAGNPFSAYLFGSAVLDDFRPGWSDIDIIVLTRAPLMPAQAEALVCLRQAMQAQGDPYARLVEGGILSLDGLLSGAPEPVVYWGTSGQRVTDGFTLDAFSLWEIEHCARLLHGPDVRQRLPVADGAALRGAVANHLATIRRYAQETGESVYSAGWLLDIARGLHTLRYGTVAPKTAAARWALAEGLAPDADTMRRAIALREAPAQYLDDPGTRAWLRTLGPAVQRFADVLEAALAAGDAPTNPTDEEAAR